MIEKISTTSGKKLLLIERYDGKIILLKEGEEETNGSMMFEDRFELHEALDQIKQLLPFKLPVQVRRHSF